MGDALISQIFEQFTMVTSQKIAKEYKLVVGVEKEIHNISQKLKLVQDVIESAERRQVSDPLVKRWLESLKDVAYDVDDVICEWNTATRKMKIKRSQDKAAEKKVCYSFLLCSCFDVSRVVHRHDIAITIRDINKRLDAIVLEGKGFNLVRIDVGGQESRVRPKSSTTSSIEVPDVFGRGEDKSTLISKLCSENSVQAVKETLQIVSVVGLGGMGKTTLAKLIYNCDEVKNHFTEWIWVCVPEPYDDVRVAKAIVESVEKRAPDVTELETALQLVKNALNGKKFLLVLDDMGRCKHKSWDKLVCNLKVGAPGSRVLVTTRNQTVAKTVGSSYIHQLGQLSDQDCWTLFSRIAFNEKTEDEKEALEEVGREISRQCKGLPLSAYTIGGLMRSKSSLADWRKVSKSEFWEVTGAEEDLSPPLMLSYYDLPSKLRQCFIYCAKFPKYYYIEADNLIKLWIAQGYLTEKNKEETALGADMEEKGRSCLDELIMRCFFQNMEKDKESGIVTRFKMHDIVHDFAQYFTKNECAIVKPDSRKKQVCSASANIRHLTWIRGDDAPFPESFEKTEKLHTFWVQSFYDSPPIVSQVDAVSPELFNQMKYLKALDLSHNRLRVLPDEVEKVINLRYLNLSFNPLEKLPESVCDLYNLQSLKLVACNHLTELPQGIGKLENLRHLEIDKTDNLSVLPGGVSKLQALRTLSKFVIRGGGDPNGAACKIKDLRDLNSLQGRLDLEGLGNIADATEAKMAELKKKEDLVILSMNFKPLAQTDQIMCNVAEALQPHTNLVRLEMKFYGGSQFPNWMVSLSHLKKLVVLECQSCEQLPALGELPMLEKLHLESINNLKCIDQRFLNSNPEFSKERGAFPKLKKLEIVRMRNLEEWNMSSAKSEGDESNMQVMPLLRHLKISECDKLQALPETLLHLSTSVRRLSIKNCTILQQRYRRGGDERKKISHIRKIKLS
ncbi:hypothetical protein DCAR_0518453 [Daucus carota subsp. sativus]|uniref:Uncharacterized protein n=2 Tax=Daucus carota subsp. sativus TaxID=79200 RepID=A0A164X9A5_DAUCS|nr:hypothetical protein DCAR_0518453 [Daucus carota subsp. sativus]